MPLDRDRIVDCAFDLLREQGLGALTMRRLAAELGVAPGAIYWHVRSKQDLLAEVAERIVGGLLPPDGDAAGARNDGSERIVTVACALRAALLGVRDGADVVSLALALRPLGLRPVRDVARLFADRLPPRQARWAARTLVHFVLGTVAEEQNRAELARAGHLPLPRDEGAAGGDPAGFGRESDAGPGSGSGPGSCPDADADAVDDTWLAFRFGVQAIVNGSAVAPG